MNPRWARDEAGQTTTEYVTVVGMIVLATLGMLGVLAPLAALFCELGATNRARSVRLTRAGTRPSAAIDWRGLRVATTPTATVVD